MKIDKIQLLDDMPASNEPDSFHHSVYASTLRDILLSNRPGLSVGLFGKWGYGKSTTIDRLEEMLKDKATVVVFNAWKTGGDSLRKQLLLAILEKIDPTEADRYKEIIGVPDIKKALAAQEKARKQGYFRGIVDALCQCWIDRTKRLSLIVLAIGMFILAGLLVYCKKTSPSMYAIAEAIVPTIAISIFVISISLLWKKYLTVIGVPEAMSESKILQYPEHFRDTFERQITRFCKKLKNRLVVVIDDLDRCESDVVVEALSAVRLFADQEKILGKPASEIPGPGCQFIVPCDEHQVVLALEANGHYASPKRNGYHNYSSELLRKFFDVVVRMDRFLPGSLASYAETQAETIGLSASTAREFIDLVLPKDPREVKKLLNSLKLAKATLARRQKAGILPADSDMPELERTLMVLVALRESSPDAYEEICENPALLQEVLEANIKPSKTILQVFGLLRRAGRTSPITTEYLISGQYERELMGLENGGAFALAFRNQDHEKFNEILAASSDKERVRLRVWMNSKIEHATTISRLRGDLSMLIDFSSIDDKSLEFIIPCVDACISHNDLIEEVLDDFPNYDELRGIIENVSAKSRETMLNAVLSSFLGDPNKRDRELGLLLYAVNLLSDYQKHGLLKWLTEAVKTSNNIEQDSVVQRVYNAIIPNKSICLGLAPDVGVILAQRTEWTDGSSDQTQDDPISWPRAQLVTILIGANASAAWDAISAIFSPQGQLATASSLHSCTPGVRAAWYSVNNLAKVIDANKASQLFPFIWKWLSQQSEETGTKLVLDTISPFLLVLGTKEADQVGTYLANVIWAKPEDTWLLDVVGNTPSDQDKAQAWLHISQNIFKQLSDKMKNVNELNNAQIQVLSTIKDMGWSVQKESDELLGQKLNTFPPQGNTKHIETWTACLTPLMGKECPNSSTAIRALLKSRQHINEALLAGMVVLWSKGIGSEDATIIANMCIDSDKQLPKLYETLSPIMNISGSERIIKVCVDLMKDDQNWMKEHSEVLAFSAKYLSIVEKDIQTRFLNLIGHLIILDEDASIILGLKILKQCSVVGPTVMKEVHLRMKSNNEEIREMAESLNTKHGTVIDS